MTLDVRETGEFCNRTARGIIHNPFVGNQASTPLDPDGDVSAYDWLPRGRARQIDFQFWLAASAADKVHTLQLWGLPESPGQEPKALPSDAAQYYTSIPAHLATLQIKYGGDAVVNKHPSSGKVDTVTWYRGSFVAAETYRWGDSQIQIPRNVDDGKILLVRTERLIFGSFLWLSASAMDTGATAGFTEAFLID